MRTPHVVAIRDACAVILRYWGGLSYNEIAMEFGKNGAHASAISRVRTFIPVLVGMPYENENKDIAIALENLTEEQWQRAIDLRTWMNGGKRYVAAQNDTWPGQPKTDS